MMIEKSHIEMLLESNEAALGEVKQRGDEAKNVVRKSKFMTILLSFS